MHFEPNPTDVITFWKAAGEEKWFTKDTAFDEEIRTRFEGVWEAGRRGDLATWEQSDDGLLALIILLDQFPRNMFRNDAKAFSSDAVALRLAGFAVKTGLDNRVDLSLRLFIYLPFEHSERLEDQQNSLALFEKLGSESHIRFARIHYDIISRFGRFPHRNALFGRETTVEEQAFLDEGGFAG